jgi:pimeloyl-ACP methyl ester carboxylesterase
VIGLAAGVHRPRATPTGVLVACVPGGGYSRAVFDIHVPGHDRTSLIDELTGLGHAVVSVDLPEPGPGEGDAADLTTMARALATLVEDVADQLGCDRIVGLGHSLGGAVVVATHALARPFAALVVLGYSPAWESVLGLDAPDDESLRALTRSALERLDPELWAGDRVLFPRDSDSPFSFAPDVPPELRLAADADHRAVARGLAVDFGIRPIGERAARAVDCPVLLVFGDPDASPDPGAERRLYPSSPAVELVLLPRSAHLHVVSSDRFALWSALEDWLARTVRPSGEDDA